MNLLARARDRLRNELLTAGIDLSRKISIRPLTVAEAVGPQAAPALALVRGPEHLIQAEYDGIPGQAFTDRPQAWSGTILDALELEFSDVAQRAWLVATINALCRRLRRSLGTNHCRDGDPERCGPRLADHLAKKHPVPRIGMFGYQPFMVRALVERFGADALQVADLNPAHIGQTRDGVTLRDGNADLDPIVEWCTVGLVTGSSIVNDTLDRLWHRFNDERKPMLLFGNTIAGVAALLDLDRYCPFAT